MQAAARMVGPVSERSVLRGERCDDVPVLVWELCQACLLSYDPTGRITGRQLLKTRVHVRSLHGPRLRFRWSPPLPGLNDDTRV